MHKKTGSKRPLYGKQAETQKVKEQRAKDPDYVPTGLVDRKAYGEYLALQAHDLLKDQNVLHQTSDEELVVNLRTTHYNLEHQIKHLPKKEREMIMEKWKAVRSLIGQMTGLKRQAFGIQIQRGYGDSVLNTRSAELLELFGRFHNSTEVHKVVIEEWGYDVTWQTVDNFRKQHIEKIKERQEEYRLTYNDIRLYHKRSRLDELVYLYGHRKSIYSQTGNKDDYRLLLATLEQIKKEVDGDLTVNINENIEITINQHLQGAVLKSMSLTDIILARIAARQQVDPRVLLYRLHNSFYAKFSGFQRPDNNLMTDEIIYPSATVYNFDKIHQQGDQIAITEAKLIPVSTVTVQQISKAKSLKDQLLDNIKKKQEELGRGAIRIEAATVQHKDMETAKKKSYYKKKKR